jgi:phosphoglycerate dehydrogenase-like enzyme
MTQTSTSSPQPGNQLVAVYVLDQWAFDVIYGPDERRDIHALVDVREPRRSAKEVADDPSLLSGVDVIFTGWSGPKLDAKLLATAKDLKLCLYGAGSVQGIVTDAMWERGVTVCSAWAANAVPVSEFTLANILLSLKRTYAASAQLQQTKKWHRPAVKMPGAFGSTVGLISLGMIGSRVAELLKAFDVKVIAWSPYTSPQEAAALGVELVATLEEVFTRADVVSLHTAWKKETENLIRGTHFELMREGATFINTSRGAVVHEQEMIDVLKRRPDLWAVLDVCYPEPPAEGSLLYELPNVVLTPHIAGAMDRECQRMGRYMVQELERYVTGQGLKWSVSKEMAARMA